MADIVEKVERQPELQAVAEAIADVHSTERLP